VNTELLSIDEVKKAEKEVAALGLSEKDLMERAGRAVAEVIFKEFSLHRTLVFCGLGKNGGDAKIAAEHLKEKGWPVEIITLKNLPSFEKIQDALSHAELVVDGLVGTGLSRPLEGDVFKLVELINASGKPVVAVDIPTGIESDSGACCGEAIRATHTVTFFRARPGHYLLPGRVYTGKLSVQDIGISDEFLPLTSAHLNCPSLWIHSIKEPQPSDHKYTRGACLVMGGGSMSGAVRLASVAARRVGAGLVRLSCKTEEYPIYAGAAWGDVILPLASAKEYLEAINDVHNKALLWGTGASPMESTREQALLLLSTKKPCVLDGGALSSFAGKALELTSHLHENVILTPHEGEFLRLFPHLAFLKNKAEKALVAAAEAGAIIVLKGYDTIIASPHGELYINANAPATLATAGTGDVLAGLMVGLLAQDVPSFQAAAAAVWIHGEAGNRRGLGMIAEDLLGEIPPVLQFLSGLRQPLEF
jgi:hydroxyethylthiazole kinase-like uncharacterized protein yjeF